MSKIKEIKEKLKQEGLTDAHNASVVNGIPYQVTKDKGSKYQVPVDAIDSSSILAKDVISKINQENKQQPSTQLSARSHRSGIEGENTGEREL